MKLYTTPILLLFSLHHKHISIVLSPPTPPTNFYCFPVFPSPPPPPHFYNFAYFLSFYFQAQCSDPGSPVHGRRRGNIFRHNSWVQFLCDVHYMLHGEEWIQCIDGSWSALLPKCIGKPATLDGMFFYRPLSVFFSVVCPFITIGTNFKQ